MKRAKRVRREPDEAKALILFTAERLMLEEGYAAVTMRAVAKAAGLSSPLVHYYFETADDLLVALYRHSAEQDLKYLQRALSAEDPLAALWSYQTDTARTAIGVEFLALANHRKVVKAEIARYATHARDLQAETITRLTHGAGNCFDGCSPEGMSMLLTSISRNLIMEDGVGISSGHAEARAYIERALKQMHKSRPSRRKSLARAVS